MLEKAFKILQKDPLFFMAPYFPERVAVFNVLLETHPDKPTVDV